MLTIVCVEASAVTEKVRLLPVMAVGTALAVTAEFELDTLRAVVTPDEVSASAAAVMARKVVLAVR